MITSLITELQPSLYWSTVAIWQQASMRTRCSECEGKNENAAGKKLGQQNALTFLQSNLHVALNVKKRLQVKILNLF